MNREIQLPANVKFNKGDSIGFLISEYNQCFDQMRHYDGVGISLIKFALTGYVALISGMFALFKYLEVAPYRDITVGGIVLLTFLIGCIVLALMVRNRVYYIVVVRQVNSLRNYFLNNSEIDFIKYNVCYIDPYYPRALSWLSTYTLLFAIVAILNGILGGVGSYLIIAYHRAAESGASWIVGLVVSIMLVISQLIFAAYYLSKSDSLYLGGRELPQKVTEESSNE